MIADAMGISTAYLSRMFKQSTNEGLLEYISRYRVMQACKFFKKNPDTQVKDVCEQAGYGNLTTFTRLFKKHTGITPGQYREHTDLE